MEHSSTVELLCPEGPKLKENVRIKKQLCFSENRSKGEPERLCVENAKCLRLRVKMHSVYYVALT